MNKQEVVDYLNSLNKDEVYVGLSKGLGTGNAKEIVDQITKDVLSKCYPNFVPSITDENYYFNYYLKFNKEIFDDSGESLLDLIHTIFPKLKGGECIDLGTPLADKLGFTQDKFNGYLWEENGFIWISYIESLQPHNGNVEKLFNQIEALGYKIIVPTPMGRMIGICKARGMDYVYIEANGDSTVAMIKKAHIIK